MSLLISACIAGVWGAALTGLRHLAHNRYEKKRQDQFNVLRERLENPWSEGAA